MPFIRAEAINHILAGLSERSTWQGIVALPGASGNTARPDLVEAVITFSLATAGLINVLFPDAKLQRCGTRVIVEQQTQLLLV